MKLLDSNIVIYAIQPENAWLRQLIVADSFGNWLSSTLLINKPPDRTRANSWRPLGG